MKAERKRSNHEIHQALEQKPRPQHRSASVRPRSADFQVCCIAGFQTRAPSANPTRSTFQRPADLEIGDTADWEVCATTRGVNRIPAAQLSTVAQTSKSAVSQVSKPAAGAGLAHDVNALNTRNPFLKFRVVHGPTFQFTGRALPSLW